jgi:hypothetical protein
VNVSGLVTGKAVSPGVAICANLNAMGLMSRPRDSSYRIRMKRQSGPSHHCGLVARCPLEKSSERFPVDARGDEQRGAGEEAEEVSSREFVHGRG